MKFTKVLSLVTLAVLVMGCQQEEAQKPNILFLFTDDFSYNAVHTLGNETVKTPNIDRLINSGANFTHTYNMGGWNGAICMASRAMIISGRSIWNADSFRQGWKDGDSLAMQQTWGKMMERAGYDTYMSGKWHVDIDPHDVFQTVRHVRGGMPPDSFKYSNVRSFVRGEYEGPKATLEELMPIGYNRPKSEDDNEWDPVDPKFGGFWDGGQHWSEVLRNDAIDYLDMAREDEDPFFMYLAFNAPHDPRQAPQKYFDMYPIENISAPENWLPEYPHKDDMGCEPHLRDEALAPFPRTEYAVRKHIQEYYAIISHLDEQIGIILDHLEKTGQAENTYVFFTGDHGLSVGHHGLLGKQNMFDHSMRVPLAVVGPGISPGTEVKNDIYLQDIMATSLDLAGIENPDFLDFNSFKLEALGQKQNPKYEEIYGAYMGLQRMIRKDGFKLIVYPKIDKILLFDLEKDPMEMNNLSDESEYKNKVKLLLADLMKLQQEYNDDLDLRRIFDLL